MRLSLIFVGAAALMSSAAWSAPPPSPATTQPETPTIANPKNDTDNMQCTQPAPGETHLPASCPKPATTSATPASTPKTLPPPHTKPAQPAAQTIPQTEPTATQPVGNSTACPKSSTATSVGTPSPPGCDSNSGIHEGGPFGH